MIAVNICLPNGDIATAWRDLAARASSNVFMDPAALCAAQATGFAEVRVLLAWGRGRNAAQAGRPVGAADPADRAVLAFGAGFAALWTMRCCGPGGRSRVRRCGDACVP